MVPASFWVLGKEVGYYLSFSPSKDGKEFQMKEVKIAPVPKKTNPIAPLCICSAKLQKEDCIKTVSFKFLNTTRIKVIIKFSISLTLVNLPGDRRRDVIKPFRGRFSVGTGSP